MNKLLAEVIDAHGGMDRWNAYEAVEASMVSGGGFFALKGLIQDPDPRRMTVWLHEQRSSAPYPRPPRPAGTTCAASPRSSRAGPRPP
jgi:hypothetical protein